MDMDASRNVGNDTAPSPSPSEVRTNAATAQVATEHRRPETDGLAAGSPSGLVSKIGMVSLAILCLTPLLVAAYDRTLSYAPMKGLGGNWSSDAWQSDVPKAFRTRLRGETIVFYAADGANDRCENEIGSVPGLSDGPSAMKQGWIRAEGPKLTMTAWRDGGLLAVSYDQNDPWSFFTRGPSPKRTVTVRYHQLDDKPCVD